MKSRELAGRACIIGAILGTASCTSVSSMVVDPSKPGEDGIAYYMPRRPFKVSVSVDAQGVQTASVEAGDTIPDLKYRFALSNERNLVGTNHLAVTVTTTGLLTSSNSDLTSGVITIVKNLATAAGEAPGLLGGGAPAAHAVADAVPVCAKGKTYSKLYFPELAKAPQPLCNFSVTIALLGGTPLTPTEDRNTRRLADLSSSQSGLFYRRDQPYLITVKDVTTANTSGSDYIALSPDESDISFVPVTRSFFANNKVNITLSNGTVTAVDQTSDGELVALSEIPADVFQAYFKAVGSVFTAFSDNSTAQATATTKAQAATLANFNSQVCAATIAANPIAGKTPADQATAITAIQAACKSSS